MAPLLTKYLGLAVLVCFATFLPAAAVGQDSEEHATLITGARIFDGVGPDLIEGKDVLIEDGLIAAIGEDLDAPVGATIIDANGRVMTPGLADMHVTVPQKVNRP